MSACNRCWKSSGSCRSMPTGLEHGHFLHEHALNVWPGDTVLPMTGTAFPRPLPCWGDSMTRGRQQVPSASFLDEQGQARAYEHERQRDGQPHLHAALAALLPPWFQAHHVIVVAGDDGVLDLTASESIWSRRASPHWAPVGGAMGCDWASSVKSFPASRRWAGLEDVP